MRISDLLPVGAENAVSRDNLSQITGFPDRELRLRLRRERLEGHIILSNDGGGGYYLPKSPHEAFPFVRRMRKRAKEIQAVADAVEIAALEAIGQERMEGF